MVKAIDISTSALVAQRLRLDTIAANIANVNTTRDANGDPNPYVRKQVIFQVGMPNRSSQAGVHVGAIVDDDPRLQPGADPFRLEYAPGHPDADSNGYVRLPNVDLTREYVDALEASRAYEANIQAIEIAKAMSTSVSRLLE